MKMGIVGLWWGLCAGRTVTDQVRPALAGSFPLGRIGLARDHAGSQRCAGGSRCQRLVLRCRVPPALGTGGVRVSSIAVDQVFPRLRNLHKDARHLPIRIDPFDLVFGPFIVGSRLRSKSDFTEVGIELQPLLAGPQLRRPT